LAGSPDPPKDVSPFKKGSFIISGLQK